MIPLSPDTSVVMSYRRLCVVRTSSLGVLHSVLYLFSTDTGRVSCYVGRGCNMDEFLALVAGSEP